MNITEASAFYQLLKGLTSDANEDERIRALSCAAVLTEKARKVLNAGPTVDEVLPLIESLMDAVDIAGGDDEYPVIVDLGGRSVVTSEAAGGVL